MKTKLEASGQLAKLGLKPILISATEASRYVGVSESYFLQLVEEGKMPRGTKVGRLSLWHRKQVKQCALALVGEAIKDTDEKPIGPDNPWANPKV